MSHSKKIDYSIFLINWLIKESV